MTWRGSEEFAKQTGALERFVRGMNRRMVVTLTNSARWQLLGQRGGQGGDEVIDAEAFTGIGFYSRPPASGKPEVITTAIGGSKTTVIVAARDEATRKAVAQIAQGETAVYNDKAIIVVKADGTVEIRLVGGVAIALPTLKTLQDLRDSILSWTPVANDGGAALKTKLQALFGTGPNFSWPVGTTVLKGQ